VDNAIQVNESGLTVFGFVLYFLRNWVCNFLYKILNKNKPHFWTVCCYGKKLNTKQTKSCNINKVVVCTLWKLCEWIMKRQVPRGIKCCLKNLIYSKNWKNLRVNERQWVKNDERKWSERKRNFHPLVTMNANSLSLEVSNKYFFLFKYFLLQQYLLSRIFLAKSFQNDHIKILNLLSYIKKNLKVIFCIMIMI
jgi:hypothetical protein